MALIVRMEYGENSDVDDVIEGLRRRLSRIYRADTLAPSVSDERAALVGWPTASRPIIETDRIVMVDSRGCDTVEWALHDHFDIVSMIVRDELERFRAATGVGFELKLAA